MFRRPLKGFLVLMLVVSGLPATASADDADAETPAKLCGVVTNAAGWPVENALVAVALGVDAFSIITGVASGFVANQAITDATGAFELPISSERSLYTVAVAAPSSAGVSYAPFQQAITPFRDAEATACGWGYDVVLASPTHALLEITVRDTISNGTLADASVGLGPIVVTTDAEGVARIGCPAGASAPLHLSAARFVAAVHAQPCGVANTLTEANATLWRAPLTLVASVTRDVILPEAAALPFEGATVALQSFPEVSEVLDVTAADCVSSAPGPQWLLDVPAVAPLDPASPYVCQASSNQVGLATLRLPWSDAGALGVVATSAGYGAFQSVTIRSTEVQPAAPSTIPPVVPVKVAPDGQDTSVQAPGLRNLRFHLVPAQLQLTETIKNIAGANVAGATVTFSGPVTVSATTNAAGAFSALLDTGIYDVHISAATYASRDCSIIVETTAAGVGVRPGSLEPAYCWTLVDAGKAALRGTLVDKPTQVPLRSGYACVGDTCVSTGNDGTFTYQVNAGASYALAIGNNSAWATALTRGPETIGRIVELGTLEVPRVARCVSIVGSLSGSSVSGVDVIVTQGSTMIAKGLTGAANFSASLPWTDHAADAYDTTPYTTTLFRDRAWPWLTTTTDTAAVTPGVGCAVFTRTMTSEALASVTVVPQVDGSPLPVAAHISAMPNRTSAVCATGCSNDSLPNQGAMLKLGVAHEFLVCVSAVGYNTTCVERYRPTGDSMLNVAMPTRFPTVTVTVKDAHTGLPIPGASVSATRRDSLPCFEACQATAGADGAALMRLANGSYVICANADTSIYRQQCTPDNVDNAKYVGSSPVAFEMRLPRVVRSLDFEAFDAHTAKPLQGVVLSVSESLGFTCAATGFTNDYKCASTATNTNGLATGANGVRVPVMLPGEGCWYVPAKTYALGPTQTTIENDQGSVDAGWDCVGIVSQASGTAVRIDMVRAPEPAIFGKVTAPDGSVPEGVTIKPTLRRLPGLPAFNCAASVDTANRSYGDCYGVQPNDTGGFSLSLPVAGAFPYVWSLTVSAEGYHSHTIENVDTGTDVGMIVLQPEAFEVALTLDFGGDCPVEGELDVNVFWRDLETENSAILAHNTAEGCVVSFDVDEWNFQSLHIGGQTAVEKTTDAFLLVASGSGFNAVDVKQAGPGANELTLTMMSSTPTPPPLPEAEPVIVGGTVTDADKIPGTPLDAVGIPGALVVATRVEGACEAGGAAAFAVTLPTGGFTLALPCVGNYTIAITPPGGAAGVPLYLAPDTIEIDASEEVEDIEVELSRTRGGMARVRLVNLTGEGPGGPTEGVLVRLVGQDVNFDSDFVPSEGGTSAFTLLPWGEYEAEAVLPTEYTQVGPSPPIVVPPAAEMHSVIVLTFTAEAQGTLLIAPSA